MYDSRFNLIIGFHGCDRHVAESLVNTPDTIKISEEPHDWLGHGMYFWENNYERARQWAIERQRRRGGNIADAAVVGAAIQLGYCCDLMDSRFTGMLKTYYKLMEDVYKQSARLLPVNKDLAADPYKNKLLRFLDCTVIEFMHAQIEWSYKEDIAEKGFSNHKVFDSTRGVFIEGERIYDGAELFEKSHIQICIRNSNYSPILRALIITPPLVLNPALFKL